MLFHTPQQNNKGTGKLKDGGGGLVDKTFTLIHQSLTTGITVQMNEIIVFISVANHKLTTSTLKGFQENTRVCQHSFLICVSSKEQLVQHVYDFKKSQQTYCTNTNKSNIVPFTAIQNIPYIGKFLLTLALTLWHKKMSCSNFSMRLILIAKPVMPKIKMQQLASANAHKSNVNKVNNFNNSGSPSTSLSFTWTHVYYSITIIFCTFNLVMVHVNYDSSNYVRIHFIDCLLHNTLICLSSSKHMNTQHVAASD